jgi:hypothetical protein
MVLKYVVWAQFESSATSSLAETWWFQLDHQLSVMLIIKKHTGTNTVTEPTNNQHSTTNIEGAVVSNHDAG